MNFSPLAELYFLIARFLEAGPCQNAAQVGNLLLGVHLQRLRDGSMCNIMFYSAFQTLIKEVQEKEVSSAPRSRRISLRCTF